MKRRWRNGHGYRGSPHFYYAIQKYGWNNFDHIIIKNNITQFEANIYEVSLIKALKTQNEKYGYNYLHGGYLGLTGMKMSKECCAKKIGANNHKSKPVICLNDGEVYESMRQAGQSKKVSSSEIGLCCKGKRQYAGKNNEGVAYRWMWLSDYQNLDNKDIKSLLNSTIKLTSSHPVICINNNKIFNSVKQAAEYCGLKQTSGIIRCCEDSNNRKHAGKDPKTNKWLVWMYLNDYNNLSDTAKQLLHSSIKKNTNNNIHGKKIICLNSLEIFDTIESIPKFTEAVFTSNIKKIALDGHRKHGKNPITKEFLYWRYLSDYEKYSSNEKQGLLDQYYTGHFLLPQNKEEHDK